MNQLVPLSAGRPPAAFSGATDLPDMNAAAQAGLMPAFAVLGFKGRNWRLKYRGEEELLKDDRGVPAQAQEVVIVGISPAISKIWYEKRYQEGDDAAPDCFSVNGETPDAGSPKPQCAKCSVCPQNVWGSRITEAGKKAKACQDSRRIAVVPRGDIENDGYGGPVLLRVPPMSLANLDKYARDLTRFGAQPYAVGTMLSFNWDVAYPELTFSATGWLNDAEFGQSREMMGNPLIDRMLMTAVEESADATAAPAAVSNLAGGAPPAGFVAPAAPGPAHAPAPPPAATAPVQAAAPVVAAPVTTVAPAKKGFGAKSVAPATQAATPQPQPDAAAPQPAPVQAPAVQAAPANLEAAIDDLLGA